MTPGDHGTHLQSLPDPATVAAMFADLNVSETRLVARTHDKTLPAHDAFVPLSLEQGEQSTKVGEATVAAAASFGDGTLRLTFRVTTGRLDAASLGLQLRFDDWSTQVEATMPAAAYAGNRLPPTGNNKGEKNPDSGVDPEPVQGPFVPRLEVGGGGQLQFRAGDMGVPAVALFDPRINKGLVLATPQRAGGLPADLESDTMIRLAEADDGKRAVLEVMAAGVRQGMRRHERRARTKALTFRRATS